MLVIWGEITVIHKLSFRLGTARARVVRRPSTSFVGESLQIIMNNTLLCYLTVEALFGWLDLDDLYLIRCHAMDGDITEAQAAELLDLFRPIGEASVIY